MSKFWLQDPTILMKKRELLDIWPRKSMNKTESLNAISRLVIILTILGYVITKNQKILLSGLVSIIAVIILQKNDKLSLLKSLEKEGFMNDSKLPIPSNSNATLPTKENPLMNVMLHEINENPSRKPAARSYEPEIEEKVNKATQDFISKNFDDPTIEQKLFRDLGDSFNFDRSMRAWHPMPNTQCPNDQKSFANFCYGGMTSCKEGNSLACSKTANSRWIN